MARNLVPCAGDLYFSFEHDDLVVDPTTGAVGVQFFDEESGDSPQGEYVFFHGAKGQRPQLVTTPVGAAFLTLRSPVAFRTPLDRLKTGDLVVDDQGDVGFFVKYSPADDNPDLDNAQVVLLGASSKQLKTVSVHRNLLLGDEGVRAFPSPVDRDSPLFLMSLIGDDEDDDELNPLLLMTLMRQSQRNADPKQPEPLQAPPFDPNALLPLMMLGGKKASLKKFLPLMMMGQNAGGMNPLAVMLLAGKL